MQSEQKYHDPLTGVHGLTASILQHNSQSMSEAQARQVIEQAEALRQQQALAAIQRGMAQPPQAKKKRNKQNKKKQDNSGSSASGSDVEAGAGSHQQLPPMMSNPYPYGSAQNPALNQHFHASASASASAPAPAPAPKLSSAQRLANAKKEQERIEKEMARMTMVEATPSEAESLEQRYVKVAKSFPDAESEAFLSEFQLESGIWVEEDDDEDQMFAKFTKLDEMFTKQAVELWMLKVAFIDKIRESKGMLKGVVSNTMEKSKRVRNGNCDCPKESCTNSACGCRKKQQACNDDCGCFKRKDECGNPYTEGGSDGDLAERLVKDKERRSQQAKEKASKSKAKKVAEYLEDAKKQWLEEEEAKKKAGK
jgi:hypothetical protein